MDLHKLSWISWEAGFRKVVRKCFAYGKDTLLPMPAELSDDIFDVVLVYEKVLIHDLSRWRSGFRTDEDLLLVIQGDLRVRNQAWEKNGMGFATLFAPDALDRESNKLWEQLDMAPVMAVPNHASPGSASAWNVEQLDRINQLVIRFLRKRIEIFAENRYHCLVFYEQGQPFRIRCGDRIRCSPKSEDPVFFMFRIDNSIKKPGIKEPDEWSSTFFDPGTRFNLQETKGIWSL